MGTLGAQALEESDELGTNQETRDVALAGERVELRQLRQADIREMERSKGATPSPTTDVQAVPQELPPEPVDEPPKPTPATPEPIAEEPLGGIEAAICALPWDCYTAIRVARCESTLKPDAVGAGSYGLMQIQASVHAHKWPDFWEAWMIPERNLEYAWEIYQGRGWYAWSCF